MIIVHINPAGIEKVYFQADSDLVEDLCLAVWPLVLAISTDFTKNLEKLPSKLGASRSR